MTSFVLRHVPSEWQGQALVPELGSCLQTHQASTPVLSCGRQARMEHVSEPSSLLQKTPSPAPQARPRAPSGTPRPCLTCPGLGGNKHKGPWTVSGLDSRGADSRCLSPPNLEIRLAKTDLVLPSPEGAGHHALACKGAQPGALHPLGGAGGHCPGRKTRKTSISSP